jgi:LysM repeat protein
VYARAEKFRPLKEYDKAVAAFLAVINKYPDSVYAERSLRKLMSICGEKGDLEKARYYHLRLLGDFPGINDADEVQSSLGKINLDILFSRDITADSVEYEVRPGDSLFAIARKFGTTIELIKRINSLKKDLIVPAQKLKVIAAKFSIFVDKSRNILILKKDAEVLKTYKVSTGRDNCTPVGVFKIEEKMVKPVWYKVGAVVSPDSQEYELGDRWLGLSAEGYGIHGTSDESTIGAQVTHGCVRMYNAEVCELFDIVPSGTVVEIVDGAIEKDKG